MKQSVLICTFIAMALASPADPILLQDLFDFGGLGESSQTKGGFGEIDNGSGNNGTAVEGGGVVTMIDGSTPNTFGMIFSRRISGGKTLIPPHSASKIFEFRNGTSQVPFL